MQPAWPKGASERDHKNTEQIMSLELTLPSLVRQITPWYFCCSSDWYQSVIYSTNGSILFTPTCSSSNGEVEVL